MSAEQAEAVETAPAEPIKDWRGTPIDVGATAIYGAPVGRSIALVEAVVDGFTDSGRVWLLVKHRAYGGWSSSARPRVHVGPDRLTIVTALPPTDLPLEGDKGREIATRSLERHTQLLTDLERGGHAPEYWRNNGYGEPTLTQEQADQAYRAYLKRSIGKDQKDLGR